MNCELAKNYVDAYIKQTLPERTQEEFVRHVKECPQCFQELETYYIVDVTLNYFDNDKDDTYDIRGLLQNDLDKRLKKYQNKKLLIISLIVLVGIAVLFAVGVLL